MDRPTRSVRCKCRSADLHHHGSTTNHRLGDECQPFEMDPPAEALFDPKKVAIINNGR